MDLKSNEMLIIWAEVTIDSVSSHSEQYKFICCRDSVKLKKSREKKNVSWTGKRKNMPLSFLKRWNWPM